MPQRIALMIFPALLICTAASFGDDNEKLATSAGKWEQVRKACGGNYSYKVRFSSFAGFGNVTEVIVANNKVTERRYTEFNNRAKLVKPVKPGPVNPGAPKPGAKPKPAGPKWVEKGKDIGKHKEGAAAKTLDELYKEAAAVLKRDLPKHERRYLRFDKQGLLLSCFTVDTRIADDAPTKGVIISSIAVKGQAKAYKAPNGKIYPAHWGGPPKLQTRDLRPLPGGYGRGSGTLARWIKMNLDKDAVKKDPKKTTKKDAQKKNVLKKDAKNK